MTCACKVDAKGHITSLCARHVTALRNVRKIGRRLQHGAATGQQHAWAEMFAARTGDRHIYDEAGRDLGIIVEISPGDPETNVQTNVYRSGHGAVQARPGLRDYKIHVTVVLTDC